MVCQARLSGEWLLAFVGEDLAGHWPAMRCIIFQHLLAVVLTCITIEHLLAIVLKRDCIQKAKLKLACIGFSLKQHRYT